MEAFFVLVAQWGPLEGSSDPFYDPTHTTQPNYTKGY